MRLISDMLYTNPIPTIISITYPPWFVNWQTVQIIKLFKRRLLYEQLIL